MSTTQKIIVIGNDYAPYLAALTLKKKLAHLSLKIIIIDTSAKDEEKERPILSNSSFRDFNKWLGLSESKLIQGTDCELSLGVYIGDTVSTKFFSESNIGRPLKKIPFIDLFTIAKKNRINTTVMDYSLSQKMDKEYRFTPPSPDERSIFSHIEYGYRIESSQLKKHLTKESIKECIQVIHSKEMRHEKNEVALDNNKKLVGDFFIFCNKPEKNKKYENIKFEETDAIYSSTPTQEEPTTHTDLIINEKEVTQRYIIGNTLHTVRLKKTLSPKKIFGYDNASWSGNTIKLGQAYCSFPSLLISPSHLLQSQLIRLIKVWPTHLRSQSIRKIFNEKTLRETKNAYYVDQLIHSKNIGLEKKLTKKEKIYLLTGKTPNSDQEILSHDAWVSLFNCFNLTPKNSSLHAEALPSTHIKKELDNLKHEIDVAASKPPLYSAFIKKIKNQKPL